MADGVSNEPVIAATPAPISVEPRVAAGEAAEVARQAEEAKLPKPADAAPKAEPAKSEEKPPAPRTTKEAIRAAAAKVNAEPTPVKPLSVAAKEAEAAPAPSAAKDAPAAVVAKDAKAEPTAAKAAEPARAEDGKFVSTKPAAEAPAKGETAETAATAPKGALPSHTAEAPPARMSAKAKEEWASLPEESRAEVTRMEKEFTAGFAKYKTAAERDASIAEFHDMASKGGTDVKTALGKYVGMEQLLRKDPIAGLHEIAKNAGLNLRDVAAKILNQTPDAARSESDATIRDLQERLARAEAGLSGIHTERQAAVTDATTKSVTEFAAANPRFEELADDISFFLKSGRTKDLKEAYTLAERLNPAPASPATPTPAAAASSAPAAPTRPTLVPSPAQNRDAGARSIAGTPTAGSDPVRKQPSNSIREAIRKAAAAAG